MNIFLQKRSHEKELLDAAHIPGHAFLQMLKEIEFINTHLGGHAVSKAGLRQFFPLPEGPVHIAEIGCGAGDNIKALYQLCLRHQLEVHFTGVDIQASCIAIAQENCKGLPVDWLVADYKDVQFRVQPHIVFSSLFCHHFTEEELVFMLQWMYANTRFGFFINDLQRHPLAYWSIKILTKLFAKSYMVRYDAPLSVKRGFKRKEWKALLAQAQLQGQQEIRWKWAFRYLVSLRK